MSGTNIQGKSCPTCGERDPSKFRIRKNGIYRYVYFLCKACANLKSRKYQAENPDKTKRYRAITAARIKTERKCNATRAKHILNDCKGYDRKKGFANDLDLEFVEKLIANGCSYCGETQLRMGLDRIDNTIGHAKENVVAACSRCNYTRRDMPHQAWQFLIGGMKRARELRLFEGWNGFKY